MLWYITPWLHIFLEKIYSKFYFLPKLWKSTYFWRNLRFSQIWLKITVGIHLCLFQWLRKLFKWLIVQIGSKLIKLSFTRTFKYEFLEITHPWRTLRHTWNREKWAKWWFFENSVVHNTGYIPSNIDENKSIKVLKQLLDPYSIHCVHHTDVTVLWKKITFWTLKNRKKMKMCRFCH